MTDKRKLALFDNLISCIGELMWEEDEETIREKFLDLGFTTGRISGRDRIVRGGLKCQSL